MRKLSRLFILLALLILVAGMVAAEQLVIRGQGVPDTDSPSFYVSLGNFLYSIGHPDKAQHVYAQGLAIGEDPALLNNLGYYWQEQGDLEQAESYWKDAAARGSTAAQASLSVLYHEQQRYGEAMAVLDSLIKAEPDQPQHYYDYAVDLAEQIRATGQGDIDLAITYFQKADDLQPGFAHATENIAVLRQVQDALEASR